MRWLLFDLVVGAALLWLVWDGGAAEPPEAATGIVTTASAAARPPGVPSPEDQSPDDPAPVVTPRAIIPPVEFPAPVAPPAATVHPAPDAGTVASAGAAPPADRRQRLRALAREAEALFLRGRE